VLLAAMSDAEIAGYLDRTELVPLSAHTIVDRESLWSEIAKIRRRGYAEAWNERNSGGAGVSAPIHGPQHEVVGALTVSVPMDRYTRELRNRTLLTVCDAARVISQSLGAGPVVQSSARGNGHGR
jgi:DNA-binding IclR family transcriptional regulator